VQDLPTPSVSNPHLMTQDEKRASFSLACIYGLRMLGLFMVLPVFTIEAKSYTGGDDEVAIGLAVGLYGLVQAVLQIPFGMAADRLGRKKVIVFGLLLLMLGSWLAAIADSVHGLALGRALQGGGAISAAVSALLADQTRPEVRTKGMALIGASIGLMFAMSLVMGPFLSHWGGLPLIFEVTLALSVMGVGIVVFWTPAEEFHRSKEASVPFAQLKNLVFSSDLLKLYFGVFVLYGVQLATWMAVPGLLIAAGVDKADHGWVYLPAVLLSFLVMGLTLFPLEKKGFLRPLFLSSIFLVFLVQWGFVFEALHSPHIWVLELLLFFFFCGFNILEASQPSLASKIAPVKARGLTLGIYNTLQSLGIFAGAAVGGWVAQRIGPEGLFALASALLLLWVYVAWHMNYTPKSS
jgi:MFS family permease